MLKVTQERMMCTDDRLKKLRKLGFKTDGYVRSLESIIKRFGYFMELTYFLGGNKFISHTEGLADDRRQ